MASNFQVMILMLQCISFVCCSACSGTHCFLPPDYDRRLSPKQEQPLEIQIGIFVESFGNVDVANMEFETFGYISQTWNDSRLAKLNTTPIILEGNDINLIWLPDLYCINCKVSNLDNGRNSKQGMARINKDGTVFLSFMAVAVASCKMDLHNFPFDMQKCSLLFSSYAYNSSMVTYRWARKPIVQRKFMDQFLVIGEGTRTFVGKYMLGDFTISEANFTFERRIGFYLLHLYIPTIMLVCLSWTMFCLKHKHAGERITIGVTLFLTMIFINGQANTSLPKVSYIKSIDIFIVFSLAEILLIIIESILVTKLTAIKEREQVSNICRDKSNLGSPITKHQGARRVILCNNDDQEAAMSRRKTSVNKVQEESQHRSELMSIILNEKDISTGLKVKSKTASDGKEREHRDTANLILSTWYIHSIIEKSSLVFFPLSYIVFNIWYWQTYFHSHE